MGFDKPQPQRSARGNHMVGLVFVSSPVCSELQRRTLRWSASFGEPGSKAKALGAVRIAVRLLRITRTRSWRHRSRY